MAATGRSGMPLVVCGDGRRMRGRLRLDSSTENSSEERHTMRPTHAVFGILALLATALLPPPSPSFAGGGGGSDCDVHRCDMEDAVAAECGTAAEVKHHK